MKCPKCGFVSFPGLDRCKKCGQPFTPLENQQAGIPPLFRRTNPETAHPAPPASPEREGEPPKFPLRDRDLNSPSDPHERFLDSPEPGGTKAVVSETASPLDWQKELSERMQEFRRRRALISMDQEESEKTLDLGLRPPAPDPDPTEPQPNHLEFPGFDELNLRDDTLEISSPNLDTLSLDTPQDETNSREPAMEAPRRNQRNVPAPSAPLEIEMESSAVGADAVGGKGNASAFRIASLGKRFYAGLFDLMVLLSAAGVFTLIFWQAGGRFAFRPLNLVVAALIGVTFLLAYFGVFTAFASGTPGLIWAGLDVRTFEGDPPKRTDCYWRTFGYLVSVSALFLGFIWVLVDGEGLTWHDRMSRTLLVDARKDWGALEATTSVLT